MRVPNKKNLKLLKKVEDQLKGKLESMLNFIKTDVRKGHFSRAESHSRKVIKLLEITKELRDLIELIDFIEYDMDDMGLTLDDLKP